MVHTPPCHPRASSPRRRCTRMTSSGSTTARARTDLSYGCARRYDSPSARACRRAYFPTPPATRRRTLRLPRGPVDPIHLGDLSRPSMPTPPQLVFDTCTQMKMGNSLLSLHAKRSRWSRLRMRLKMLPFGESRPDDDSARRDSAGSTSAEGSSSARGGAPPQPVPSANREQRVWTTPAVPADG